jgi:hypothetical protein
MNITKNIAEQIADKLLTGAKEKIIQKEIELGKVVKNIYDSKIPSEVFDLLNNLPEKWQHTKCRVHFITDNDLHFFDVNIKDHVFGSNDHYCECSEKEYNIMMKIQTEINDIKKNIKTYKSQIVAQMLKMRTFKRIRENFPEIAIHLPEENSQNLPAINIHEILSNIKNI